MTVDVEQLELLADFIDQHLTEVSVLEVGSAFEFTASCRGCGRVQFVEVSPFVARSLFEILERERDKDLAEQAVRALARRLELAPTVH